MSRTPPSKTPVPEYPCRENPRMLPSPPRVPRGRAPRTPPGSSPSAPAREPHTERLPRALGEHATCPRERLLSSRNLENTQKIFRTLEMHHKSNIDPKNVIPIFMALYCSVLPRKNTKPGKKTNMPLRKFNKPKLCLFN